MLDRKSVSSVNLSVKSHETQRTVVQVIWMHDDAVSQTSRLVQTDLISLILYVIKFWKNSFTKFVSIWSPVHRFTAILEFNTLLLFLIIICY